MHCVESINVTRCRVSKRFWKAASTALMDNWLWNLQRRSNQLSVWHLASTTNNLQWQTQSPFQFWGIRKIQLGSCQSLRLFTARQHTDARYWYRNSVRPSVCPSRYGILRIRLNIGPIVTVSSTHGSPIILALSPSNIFTKFRQSHHLWGR